MSTPMLPRVDDTSGIDMKRFAVYEKALRKYVDSGKIPGYCSAVIYKGKLLHSDSYGMADPEMGHKYSPHTLMRLYCMSKPFVAVGILMLQERGLLSLQDPVSKYIPGFKDVGLAASEKSVFETSAKKPRPFTILHCLTHTAGLPYGKSFNEAPESGEEKMCAGLVDGVENGEVENLADFVDRLSRLPLRNPPGKEYHYSLAPDVLGRVIEVVSGKRLGKFLSVEIFKPLNMRDTGFSFPRSKASRLAAVYCGRDSAMSLGMKASELPRGKHALCRIDGKRPEESRWMEGQSCKVESGGGFMGANMGGLISTVADSARFMAMLLNGGELDGVRILQEESIRRWCLPDLFPLVVDGNKRQKADGKPFGWSALGEVGVKRTAKDVAFDIKEDFEVGECGGGGAASTYWSLNPTRDLAILWFTHQMDNAAYVTEAQNIYVACRRGVPRSSTWKPWTGVTAKKAAAGVKGKRAAAVNGKATKAGKASVRPKIQKTK